VIAGIERRKILNQIHRDYAAQ